MADRWPAPGGWTVEVVRLSLTPDRHDGEWIRLKQFGAFHADVRTPAEVERWSHRSMASDCWLPYGRTVPHRDSGIRRLGLVQWRRASRRRIGQCLEGVSSEEMHRPSGLGRGERRRPHRCVGSRYSRSPSPS
jgi:hypothetical protein